jgi:hypothetical protein
MFDINTHVNADLSLMKERRAQLMREAQIQQLFKKADEERPQFGERLMGLVGDLMISGGQKLKERSGSAQYTVEAQSL